LNLAIAFHDVLGWFVPEVVEIAWLIKFGEWIM
jgi:hypothetical protein